MSIVDILKHKKEELFDAMSKKGREKFGERAVSPDVYETRLGICNKCEQYAFTGNCKKCGCFMAMKAWLNEKKCPMGKW